MHAPGPDHKKSLFFLLLFSRIIRKFRQREKNSDFEHHSEKKREEGKKNSCRWIHSRIEPKWKSICGTFFSLFYTRERKKEWGVSLNRLALISREMLPSFEREKWKEKMPTEKKKERSKIESNFFVACFFCHLKSYRCSLLLQIGMTIAWV